GRITTGHGSIHVPPFARGCDTAIGAYCFEKYFLPAALFSLVHCFSFAALMRDPLIPPLAAIAAGIFASRFVRFGIRELLVVLVLFLLLGTIAWWRKSRWLAGVCCLLGMAAAGALADLAHRPGPPPELDAEGREPVILTGCVVEPPALAGDRERFVLEMEPGARAQVTAYARDGEPPPSLQYGQRIEVEARVRRPRNFGNPGSFDYVRYLARRDI